MEFASKEKRILGLSFCAIVCMRFPELRFFGSRSSAKEGEEVGLGFCSCMNADVKSGLPSLIKDHQPVERKSCNEGCRSKNIYNTGGLGNRDYRKGAPSKEQDLPPDKRGSAKREERFKATRK